MGSTTGPTTSTSTVSMSAALWEDIQGNPDVLQVSPTGGQLDQSTSSGTWLAGVVFVGILLSLVCGVVCTLRKVQATDAQSPFRTTWGTICFFLFQSLSLSSASRAKNKSESSTLL